MGLFSRKKGQQTELIQLNNQVTHSFRNVQKDTAYILQWLGYFYNKNLHLEQEISLLQEELKYVPKSKSEIRKIVDEFYSYEPILNRIKELNEKVDELKKSHTEVSRSHEELTQKHHEISPRLEALKQRLEEQENKKMHVAELDELKKRLGSLESKKTITIKEKIIKRITKNSKDYIKSIVLSYIKKYGKITALQLKEMVVEEQGLCSKSSFYRLLEEIEEDPEIGVIKEGKEKHYIGKISKKNY